MSEKFNQQEYIAKWSKENMKFVQAKFKKELVDEFKEACKMLGVTQSSVIREAVEETIEKAKNSIE